MKAHDYLKAISGTSPC